MGYVVYAEGKDTSPPPPTMNDTERALAALQTLMSLPGWEDVATTYLGNHELLSDLADDLTRATWEELTD
jgi:hypothetical protein